MPQDDNTNLASRIDTIERNLQKLRRDTSGLSTLTTRNREDLDHALADLDELLYAALATGRELTPPAAAIDTPGSATGTETHEPRCTHPAHDATPPEARPAATHLVTLRSPALRTRRSAPTTPPLRRLRRTRTREPVSAAYHSHAHRRRRTTRGRATLPVSRPLRWRPAARDHRHRNRRRAAGHPLLRRLRGDDQSHAQPAPDPLRERPNRHAHPRQAATGREAPIAAAQARRKAK